MTQRTEILNELKELTIIADRLSTEMPYRLPEGYFDHLAPDILRRVKAEAAASAGQELELLSPLMAKLDKKAPFTVPEGYFSELPANSLRHIKGAPEAKVVRIPFFTKAARYGIAAAVAGIIAAGAWLLVKTPSPTTGNSVTATQDVQKKVQDMSDTEMKAYLEGSTANIIVYQNTAPAEIKPEDTKYMLADVSDEELQHYVEQDDAEAQILN